jgi:heat shock protein HtpX
VAVVVSLLVAKASHAYLGRILGAEVVDDDEFPGVRNVIEGLCATFGLRVPELRVIENPVANSCVYGSGERAVMVVTTGLVDGLGLIETEGIIAHELAHLKHHDAALAPVAVTALAPLVYLTGNDQLVHSALGRGREYRADQTAAQTLRYPPGLHDALAAMEVGAAPAAGSVFTGRRMALTRWLWSDPMVGRRSDPVAGELDATSVRVAALAEW